MHGCQYEIDYLYYTSKASQLKSFKKDWQKIKNRRIENGNSPTKGWDFPEPCDKIKKIDRHKILERLPPAGGPAY
jgi:hypothetical protein